MFVGGKHVCGEVRCKMGGQIVAYLVDTNVKKGHKATINCKHLQ